MSDGAAGSVGGSSLAWTSGRVFASASTSFVSAPVSSKTNVVRPPDPEIAGTPLALLPWVVPPARTLASAVLRGPGSRVKMSAVAALPSAPARLVATDLKATRPPSADTTARSLPPFPAASASFTADATATAPVTMSRR